MMKLLRIRADQRGLVFHSFVTLGCGFPALGFIRGSKPFAACGKDEHRQFRVTEFKARNTGRCTTAVVIGVQQKETRLRIETGSLEQASSRLLSRRRLVIRSFDRPTQFGHFISQLVDFLAKFLEH